MGTTHRVYRFKEKNVSLYETFRDIKLINESLCIGENKTFYHQFSLKSPEKTEQLSSIFDINFYQLYSTFYLSNYDLLINLLEIISSEQRICFSNKLEGVTNRNYLHYWLEIEQSKLSISIIPSITEDFSMMKNELSKILDFLRSCDLIYLKSDELESLVNNLIDANLVHNGYFSYKNNDVEFSASADFIPNGSKQIRPSGIKLKFEQEYITSKRGLSNASISLYESLNKFFDKSKYKIEGSVNSNYNKLIYKSLKELNFLDFNIRSFMDLNKNSNFTANHIDLTSIYGGSIIVNNFDWKDSQPNYLDNRIYLEIDDLNNWNFQIEIAKQINEEYYFNIELLIDKELEYCGIE